MDRSYTIKMLLQPDVESTEISFVPAGKPKRKAIQQSNQTFVVKDKEFGRLRLLRFVVVYAGGTCENLIRQWHEHQKTKDHIRILNTNEDLHRIRLSGNILEDGKTFYVLDTTQFCVHPIKMREVFRRFLIAEGNPQLLLFTNDTAYMSKYFDYMLSPDQIYMLDPNGRGDGQFTAVGLAEFKGFDRKRSKRDLIFEYLIGRYGGMPFDTEPLDSSSANYDWR
jgi:hypothetical protein